MTEPLEASARTVVADAHRTCAPTGCVWYHRLYPVLRLVGLAPTPERHTGFYTESFGRLAPDVRRAAVTGTADTCLPALLRASVPGVELTVVDRCRTPGLLNEALGATPAVADLRSWAPAEPFDLVACHALIGMLPHHRQPDVLRSWRRALRTGGHVVTVQRIDPTWDPAHKGFSETQAANFAALADARCRAALDPALCTHVADDALQFAQRMRSYPLPSSQALDALFTANGFTVEQLTLAHFEGHAKAHESGPGTHRAGTFAHVVARAH